MSVRARILLTVAVAVATLVCLRLAFWQLARLEDRRARNATARAQQSLPEVAVDSGGESPLAYRRVRATGQFDQPNEVVLRGQAYQGIPGVVVVTPLRLEGSDSAVMVTRGFVPAPDAFHAHTEPIGDTGVITIRGIAQPITTDPDGGKPLASEGTITFSRLELGALRSRLPYPLMATVVQQERGADSSAIPRALPPPVLDDGPHLNYAIQWFAFATIAAVGGLILLRKR